MATLFRLLVALGLLAANQVAFADDIKGTQLADPRTPDDEKLLYAGPLPVKVKLVGTFNKVEEQVNGTLMMITEKHLYLRKDGEFRATIYHAAADKDRYKYYVVRVDEVIDAKLAKNAEPKQWVREVDAQNKMALAKFTGASFDTQQIVGRSPPPTEQQLRAIFFFSLQRLTFRINDALTRRDELLLDAFKARAKEVATYLRANRYPNEYAEEFEALISYIDRHVELQAKMNKEIEGLLEEGPKLLARQQRAAAQKKEPNLSGLLQAFLGAIPQPVYVLLGNGREGRRGLVDGEGILNGIGTIFDSQLSYANEMARIQSAYENASKNAKLLIDAARKEMVRNRAKQYQSIHALGVNRLGVPATAPPNPYEAIAKATGEGELGLAKVIAGEKCKSDFQLSDRENPFARSDFAFTEATLLAIDKSNPNKGDDIFRVAVRLAEASASLPNYAVFDFDRVDLYRVTAAIAGLAVFAECQPGVRGKVCSPRAMFAVRLLDTVENLAVIDRTGQAREQRALCLLLSGRPSDAIVESETLRVLRKESPTFWYNLSRMYAVRSESFFTNQKSDIVSDQTQSLLALEQAFRAGFSQVREVVGAADFYGITSGRKKDFDKLIEPRGKIVLNGDGLSYTNESPYAHTNVELTGVIQIGQGYNGQYYGPFISTKIPVVHPGETVRLSANPTSRSAKGIHLQSDQTVNLVGGQIKKVWMKLSTK